MIRVFTKWATIAAAMGLGFCVAPLTIRAAVDPAVRPNAEAQQPSRPLAFPAGFEVKSGQPSEGIKTGLVKLTERALTKGDFNSMLGELSRPDRERAREFKGADQGKLDVQIDKIHKEWKAKYGSDFDLKDKDRIFDARFGIIEGKVTDPAQALAHWPVSCTSTGEAVTASGRQPAAADKKEVKKEAREAKLEKGRDVAMVRFPVEFGMPEMTVCMVHHLPAFWRVDIPDDRTGEQIYNDLLANLTWIADHSDRWPSNADDGYRMVAAHAVAATYGAPLSEHRTQG